MTQLYEKMQETEAGRWASFIHDLLYGNGDAIANMYVAGRIASKNPKGVLLDLAHWLESIAFKELDRRAKDEHAWIGELREKISLDKELKKG